MSAIHTSDALIVISANIEALTANKVSILSELYKDKYCHCLCLQETHRAKARARPINPGMALVVERPHNKHGSSVFVIDGLKVNNISVCKEDNDEFITGEPPGVVVHSVYKPTTDQFLLAPLGSKNMPLILIGDGEWGYTSTDNDGKADKPPSDDTLILGDFNAHHPSWYSRSTDTRGRKMADSINGSDYGILN